MSVRTVLERVREANLTEDEIVEVYRQIRGRATDEDFDAVWPNAPPLVGDLVGTYGGTALNVLLAVLAMLIAIYYGERTLDLGEQQLKVGQEQLRQDQRQGDRPATTGALTDADMDRIAKAVRDEIDRPEPTRSTRKPSAKRKGNRPG